ncbi:MAG: response regulator [Terracidiphilus sp.]
MRDSKPKILVVDDDQAVRNSLSMILEEIGYGVRTAEDGFSALALMRLELPDILLSDLNMPGMSGFELLPVVKSRFPTMLTIAMSGAFYGDEMPSGVVADAFYQKGSNISSLLMILNSLRRAAPPSAQFRERFRIARRSVFPRLLKLKYFNH